jgi:hypothetical protein
MKIKRLQQLAGISVKKPINECYYEGQVYRFLKEKPEVLTLFKKDSLALENEFTDWDSTSDDFLNLAGSLAYYAGTCSDAGPEDFSRKQFLIDINDMVEGEEITPKTAKRLKEIAKEYNFPNTEKDMMQALQLSYDLFVKHFGRKSADLWKGQQLDTPIAVKLWGKESKK